MISGPVACLNTTLYCQTLSSGEEIQVEFIFLIVYKWHFHIKHDTLISSF